MAEKITGYTSEMCQQAMIDELKELFRDMKFTGQEGEKPLKIFKQFIPSPTDDDDDVDTNRSNFPCIIVSRTSGEVVNEKDPQLVLLQLIICCYDPKTDRQGYEDTGNIIEAIMQHFKRKPVFGEAFKVGYPRKWDLSDDDMDFYYWGIVNLICETPNTLKKENRGCERSTACDGNHRRCGVLRADRQGHCPAVHRIRGWPARKAERKSGAGAVPEGADRSAGQARRNAREDRTGRHQREHSLQEGHRPDEVRRI